MATIESIVEAMNFDNLIICADIFDIYHDELAWPDDAWEVFENKLRMQVLDALVIASKELRAEILLN